MGCKVRFKNLHERIISIKTKFLASTVFLALIVLATSCAFAGTDSKYTDKLVILMYHDIVENDAHTLSITETQEKFCSDIRYLLLSGYKPVFLSEIEPGKITPDMVCITFDDGYVNNYRLAYPVLKEFNVKAEINLIVNNIDNYPAFLTWDMCREMQESGLVEFGSHTYNAHNPDNSGEWRSSNVNGVQRFRGESDKDYKERVVDDIYKSCEIMTEELQVKPEIFAYPFGASDKYSRETVEQLFSISLLTGAKTAAAKKNMYDLQRYNVGQDVDISKILPPLNQTRTPKELAQMIIKRSFILRFYNSLMRKK